MRTSELKPDMLVVVGPEGDQESVYVQAVYRQHSVAGELYEVWLEGSGDPVRALPGAEWEVVGSGHCPVCHRDVMCQSEGNDWPVWACPYNLPDGNPHQLVHDDQAVAQLGAVQGSSYCLADHGGVCDRPHLPLHGACHDAGNY
jgi:hypothetical protein